MLESHSSRVRVSSLNSGVDFVPVLLMSVWFSSSFSAFPQQHAGKCYWQHKFVLKCQGVHMVPFNDVTDLQFRVLASWPVG